MKVISMCQADYVHTVILITSLCAALWQYLVSQFLGEWRSTMRIVG